MPSKLSVIVSAATCALLASTPAWSTVEVIFNQISGHPKALVPAGAGLPPGTQFRVQTGTGFDRPFASPDGTKFFLTGLASLPLTTEDECYIVVDGVSASTVAREGTAFGSPTVDLLALGDQRMGINNTGQFVFGVDTNAVTTADKFVIKWDGVSFVVVAREGDFVPGSVTETWGNGMNSGHIQSNGTAMFCAVETGGVNPTTSDDYCMVGATILIQTSNPIGGAAWDAFNSSDFWVTPDGLHWMMVGDDTTATTQDRILAVDGVVQAREGVPLIGSSYVSNVSVGFGGTESLLANDGSYMLRGHNVDAEDWVLRNGVVIAGTDDPITTGNTELFDDAITTDCFFSIASNSVGDYVIGGVTNASNINANAVLVKNGTTVIAREGDMIDLNGNGYPDDDCFIGVFNNDDCFLTDDGILVFFADTRNGALVSLGQMVLRLNTAVENSGLAMTQWSWQAPDGTFSQQFSNYGEMHITMPEPPTDQLLWVNATINGDWSVQNEPLMEIDGEGQVQTYSLDFAYLTLPGTPVTSVMVQIEISPLQLANPPSGPAITLPVTEHLYSPGNTLGVPNTTGLFFVPAAAVNVSNPPSVVIWEKVRRRGVPGIAEHHWHCTPGGFARSLAWMNVFYNLKLPANNNDVQEIYDKLRDINHMMTTKENGTRLWGKNADGTLNCDDPDWGKMMFGVRKFINDKGLAAKLTTECKQFKSQDVSNPQYNPCDLFRDLQKGKDVIGQWGYWPNDATVANNQRNGGHTITVVGAVKCGTEVTIYFRDDVSGKDNQKNLDQTGDMKADKGVKKAKFVAGGPTGWKLRGERWEGWDTVCPKPQVIVDAIIKFLTQELAKVTQVRTDLNNGDPANPQTLAQIQAQARDILDLCCVILATAEDLDPPCPSAVAIAQRLKEKAINLDLLAGFLREDPTIKTCDEMIDLINQMQMQLTQLQQALAACMPAPCPADVDDDGDVDIDDLLAVITSWGPCLPPCPADIDNDGDVDIDDLLAVITGWGLCPP